MATQQVVRTLTVEDLMAMEVGELETLVQLGNSVLVAKTKQAIQDQEDTIQSTKQERQELLRFEPQVQECFASNPVKLNVGGTYFSTSVGNLTREPNTFFAAMFSGRWEIKINPKDDAIFIDRDPTMFATIINYLRTRKIVLGNLTLTQRETLYEEADFYQIASLLDQLSKPTFCQQVRGKAQLSQNDLRVSSTEIGTFSYMVSSNVFSTDVQEMKVKLIKGYCVMVGVAPKSILDLGNSWETCGWYIWTANGSLCSQDGAHNEPFKHEIESGSIVTVKLDLEFNISFMINGEDWGIAYRAVVKDYSTPLHLAVSFGYSSSQPDLAQEGIIDLL
ncbi:hypothetical protein BASA81_002445 [Batrachochytrium salamandrivorans]|nr:hypothetical protein BASA81_002445 [Batrachochytrium salamandrivorans]